MLTLVDLASFLEFLLVVTFLFISFNNIIYVHIFIVLLSHHRINNIIIIKDIEEIFSFFHFIKKFTTGINFNEVEHAQRSESKDKKQC